MTSTAGTVKTISASSLIEGFKNVHGTSSSTDTQAEVGRLTKTGQVYQDIRIALVGTGTVDEKGIGDNDYTVFKGAKLRDIAWDCEPTVRIYDFTFDRDGNAKLILQTSRLSGVGYANLQDYINGLIKEYGLKDQ